MGNTIVTLSGNSTLNYIYDSISNSKYFTLNDDPTPLTDSLIIQRSDQNLNEPITVSLNFTTSISNIFNFILINIDNVIFDGQNSTITIDYGVNNLFTYPGLFCYDSETNYTNVVIKNININVVNSSILNEGAGWICSNGFCNITVNNCSSNGPIPNNGGGIFGEQCINCTANNCYSTGNLGSNSGGIFGASCNYNSIGMINTVCNANNCYSTGIILNGSGGIFGGSCNLNAVNSNCYAYNCYSAGNIIDGSGGIFGAECNVNATNANCNAINCYSTGNIKYGSGGIFGANCNDSAIDSNCNANKCYSIGIIGFNNSNACGGIFGADAMQQCTANFCASYGLIYGDNSENSNGGIFADGAQNSYAYNCFSIGNIGYGSGGIFQSGLNCYANFCYSIGNIGPTAGGIFGSGDTCIASYCYSNGYIADQAGGIFGNTQTNAYNTNNSTASFCYSLGSLGINSGGIFGYQSTNCAINNCYVLGSVLFGYSDNPPNVDFSSGAEYGSWNDNNALSVMNNNENSNWFIIDGNIPFLLSSYTNCINPIPIGCQYFYNLTNITTVSNNGNIPLLFLIGYYQTSQLSHDIQNGLYGYNIISRPIEVNIQQVLPTSMEPLIEKFPNFNPAWF